MGCRNDNPTFQWETAPPGKCRLIVFARYRSPRNIRPDRLLGAWEVVVQYRQIDGVPGGERRMRGLEAGGCVLPVLHLGCNLIAVPQIVLCAKRSV